MSHSDVQELRALVEALQRKVNSQAEELDRLEDRIGDVEAVVDTDFDALAYEQMTKRDKVRELRTVLIRQATTQGNAAMTYNAVQSCFGGRPSPGHAYDLMREAGEAEGFKYQERSDYANRIVVNIDDVKDEALIHAANNEIQQEAAET